MEVEVAAIDRFFKVLQTLEVLDASQLDQLQASLAHDPARSPMVALLESGFCDHQDLELVELLMAADTAIPGYELLGVLGRGGMGVVWKARQSSLDRIVALKTITATRDASKTLIARFEREAAAVARLSHPNIVSAVDFGRIGKRLYLAMEYVAGEDLGMYVQRCGRRDEMTAVGLVRQIASGLAHASRQNVIHRDIKPANILLLHDADWMVSSGGIPLAKITDFGLALLNEGDQSPEARLTSHQSALGSPHYMSPDQLTGAQLDTRADIYALGATLFHLLVGHAPWEGQSLNRIVRDKLQGDFPIAELDALGVSESVVTLVKRMTEGETDRRPQNCQLLLSDIDYALVQLKAVQQETLKIPVRRGTVDDLKTRLKAEVAAMEPLSQPTMVARQVDQRSWLTRRAVVRAALAAAPMILIMIWWLWEPRSLEPVDLVVAGVPQSLFDGRTIPITDITEGGLGTADGRVLMSGSTISLLGFRLPEWEYLKFDVIVELPPSATLDVAFGNAIASKREACLSVRLEHGMAQPGELTKLNGKFSPTGQAIELKGDRRQHYLEVEKNAGIWLVRLYKDPDMQLVLPMLDTQLGTPQLVFVARHTDDQPTHEQRSSEQAQFVALSELLVVEMKPAEANASSAKR